MSCSAAQHLPQAGEDTNQVWNPMMINTNNSGDVRTITLAGREWAVPKLAPKQNRIVVPALLQLVPKILCARDESAGAGEKGSYATLARYLDTTSYDALASLVFSAL